MGGSWPGPRSLRSSASIVVRSLADVWCPLDESPLLPVCKAFAHWIVKQRCQIEDRDTGRLIPLKLNDIQFDLMATMMEQVRAGRPIRIVKPKARKLGVSTFWQAFAYFACLFEPGRRASWKQHG